MSTFVVENQYNNNENSNDRSNSILNIAKLSSYNNDNNNDNNNNNNNNNSNKSVISISTSPQQVDCLAFHPHFKNILAIGTSRLEGSIWDGSILLYDITNNNNKLLFQISCNCGQTNLIWIDNHFLCTGQDDGNVIIYQTILGDDNNNYNNNINGLQMIEILNIHDNTISSLSMNKDKTILAIGSWDSTISLFNIDININSISESLNNKNTHINEEYKLKCNLICRFHGTTSKTASVQRGITQIAWNQTPRNKNLFASISADHFLRIWDINQIDNNDNNNNNNNNNKHVVKAISKTSFKHQPTALAWNNTSVEIIIGLEQGSLLIFNISKSIQKPISHLQTPHKGSIQRIVHFPIESSSFPHYFATCGDDKNLCLYARNKGYDDDNQLQLLDDIIIGKDYSRALSCSNDGYLLAIGNYDCSITIFDFEKVERVIIKESMQY